MTTSDHVPHQPGEPEPTDDELLNEPFDEVEYAVSKVTSAAVQARLRDLLAKNGYVHPDDVPEAVCESADPTATNLTAIAGLTADTLGWAETVRMLRTARRELLAAQRDAQMQTELARQAEDRAAAAERRAADLRAGADAYVDAALDRAQGLLDDARAEAQQIIDAAQRQAEAITAQRPSGTECDAAARDLADLRDRLLDRLDPASNAPLIAGSYICAVQFPPLRDIDVVVIPNFCGPGRPGMDLGSGDRDTVRSVAQWEEIHQALRQHTARERAQATFERLWDSALDVEEVFATERINDVELRAAPAPDGSWRTVLCQVKRWKNSAVVPGDFAFTTRLFRPVRPPASDRHRQPPAAPDGETMWFRMSTVQLQLTRGGIWAVHQAGPDLPDTDDAEPDLVCTE